MRWHSQAISNDDGALPGLELPGLRTAGLLRTVRSPEFAGVTFHEVLAKSALSKVPAASQMPFRWTINPYRGCSHACTYCVDPSTLVLMADGRQKPVRDVMVGDRIIGTELDGKYRRFVETEVQARWGTTKHAYRVTLEDGTEIVASGDHRFLTERGWKHVAPLAKGEGQRPYLTTDNRLQGFGLGMITDAYAAPRESAEYRRGYLTGMVRGDGMLFDGTYARKAGGTTRVTMFRLALADEQALTRSQNYLAASGVATDRRPFATATEERRAMDGIFTSKRATFAAIHEIIEWPAAPSSEWSIGFLAGTFDAEGGSDGQILRISSSDDRMLTTTMKALDLLGMAHVREPANKIGVTNIRVVGGLSGLRRFCALTNPALTRKLKIVGTAVKTSESLRIVSIESLGGDSEMVDITTGTGDFIANGVISHNCFARPTHEYLDLDAGHDFDSQVVVKVNADQVLRAELAKPSWTHEPVALGTNTDPYQRAEGRYKLMPGIISALADSATPFSILTKGTLLRRDLALLAQAAERVDVGLGVSLAFADEVLQQSVEPGTPSPRARLDLIRAIRAAGLPCGVMVAPVLPWLTDSLAHLERLLDTLVDAGATGVTVLPLHLRPGAREWYLGWLERSHPHLLEGYGRVYARGAYAHKGYRDWLWERVRPLLDERGLGRAAMHRVDGGDGRDSHDEGDYPRGALAGVRADGTGAASMAGDVGSETLF